MPTGIYHFAWTCESLIGCKCGVVVSMMDCGDAQRLLYLGERVHVIPNNPIVMLGCFVVEAASGEMTDLRIRAELIRGIQMGSCDLCGERQS